MSLMSDASQLTSIDTLLVDNYDSFTYNLYSLLTEVNGRPPTVVKNDVEWDSLDFDAYDNVVISPGPGRPEVEQDFGISGRVITESGLPVLGVCLGHQGLCHLFGGSIDLAPTPVHGRSTEITHTGVDLFAGIPSPFSVVRYHSLIVTATPEEFEEIAWTRDGLLMAMRHRSLPLWGVQFHPESISTEYGRELLANFRDLTLALSDDTDISQAESPMFTIETRTLEGPFDPQSVFDCLFADGNKSFWLDGSAAHEPQSRFTIMGDCSGPYAEYVTYSVAETAVTIESANGDVTTIHSTFFDYIDSQLRVRATPPRHDLPFEFGLGYVGYLGYELKADTVGQLVHTAATPDASMVFCDRALVFDHNTDTLYLIGLATSPGDPDLLVWFDLIAAQLSEPSKSAESATVGEPRSEVPQVRPGGGLHPQLRHDRDTYLELISQCLAEIRYGETYEVCLTNMATVEGPIDPVATYSYMREINPTPYSALLKFPGLSVLSASPERFLRIDADRVVESKPIKGTRPRGSTLEQDDALKTDLASNEKDKAENLMIVDLVRNDLAQVCVPGSVHVPKLFDIETYAPVHQLVSTIRGRLRDGVSAAECVRAAFPGGSMTGAPKIRTMAIIDKLEDGPRGVYSGAIGYFSITGTADFSIVIRTIVATEHDVTYGVGGAIVALSDPADEFEETMVKAGSMRRALVGRVANDR